MRSRVLTLAGVLSLAVTLSSACDKGEEPRVPGTLTALSPVQQAGVVATAVATPPSVTLKDTKGRPMNNVAVTFAVTTGGGSVAGGSARTGTDGTATVTSWTLGTVAGENTLTASAQGVPPVVFSATTTPGPAAALAVTAGNSQTATVNTNVPIAPAVAVRDAFGNGIAGATVTFSVSGGGGSIVGGTQTTDAAGVARLGSWKLGTIAGQNTLLAGSGSATTTTVTATGTPGPAAQALAFAGGAQSAAVNANVAITPVVIVRDQFGNAVPNAAVTFAVTAGGGSVTDASKTTNTNGMAAVGSWRLGAAGENSLSAQVGAGTPAIFTANASPTPVNSSYALTVRYLSAATPAQQRAVNRAAIRWQEIVTGDLPDVAVFGVGPNLCGAGSPGINENIDDLLVFIDFREIDGVNGVLGQAGPCFIRTSNSLSIVGTLRLDEADLAALETQGRMEDVILHEIGHVIGFGSLWAELSLLNFAQTDSVSFGGLRARAAFASQGGGTFVGLTVPVENCRTATGTPMPNCGNGNRDAHWRELVMGRELMTGFISVSGATNPLSAITIESLADLGYTVNLGAADTYTVSATKPSTEAMVEQRRLVELAPDWRIRMIRDR